MYPLQTYFMGHYNFSVEEFHRLKKDLDDLEKLFPGLFDRAAIKIKTVHETEYRERHYIVYVQSINTNTDTNANDTFHRL